MVSKTGLPIARKILCAFTNCGKKSIEINKAGLEKLLSLKYLFLFFVSNEEFTVAVKAGLEQILGSV